MKFTLAYQSNSHPRTQVLVQEFSSLGAAIAHARTAISSVETPAVRVLIRMGDAAHTDPVVWDSEKDEQYQNTTQVIINRVDNMLSDLASMQTRMLALKEDIHNLLKG